MTTSVEPRLRFAIKQAMSLRLAGKLRKAHRICTEILEVASTERLLPLIARARTELGIVHATLDDPVGALAQLNEAISIKGHLGDLLGLKQAYLCLGYAYARAGETAEALAACSRSLELNRQTEDRFGELICLEAIARLDASALDPADRARVQELERLLGPWNNPRVRGMLDQLGLRQNGT